MGTPLIKEIGGILSNFGLIVLKCLDEKNHIIPEKFNQIHEQAMRAIVKAIRERIGL